MRSYIAIAAWILLVAIFILQMGRYGFDLKRDFRQTLSALVASPWSASPLFLLIRGDRYLYFCCWL